MIEKIDLWENNPKQNNKVPIVRIKFKYATNWCVFTLQELKELLRIWIKGEEMAYPPSKGFKGRWMLFDEIKKVFDEK